MSALLESVDEAQALEQLHALGCTDGLPVVIPTVARVTRMVLASGLDADLLLGEMGPMMGSATVQKVAVAAVMAGALPDYMPVIIAAVKAVIAPQFDLTEMQATTHCTAPLIIVNGPARFDCGPVASGFGALGPGHRANASIGRALRLAMMNIGGARPGSSDMALLGHPGKFTYCLAEDEEHSPFPPMHVGLGYASSDSVVTVIGAEAPHSVLFSCDADDPQEAENFLAQLALGIANMATNNAILTGGAAVVVLNPEHAEVFARAGLTREAVRQRLWTLTHLPIAQLRQYGGAFADRFAGREGDYRAFNQPEDILILVAGGSGLYSMVMPSWCAGAHHNSAVSMAIDNNQFCEIPSVSVSEQ